MRLAVLIAAVVSILAVAPGASAVVLVDQNGAPAQPYQAWADAARVPTPAVTVRLRTTITRCSPGHLACAWGDRIEISCREGRWCRYVLLHEVGHHYDFHMPDWKRRVFARIAGAWNQEWFAEAYARCALGVHAFRRRQADGSLLSIYGYGFTPSRSQQRRLCLLVRS